MLSGSSDFLAHCYLEVFKGIGVLVGGVDTVDNPVHRRPLSEVRVEDQVYSSRFDCGYLVQCGKSYIVVIPPI